MENDIVSPTGAPLGPYPVKPEVDTECTCQGRCGTCQDAVGYDTEVECPDCPLHGWTNIAKQRRREILDV